MQTNIIYNKDCLVGMQQLPNESVHAIIPDAPYTDGKRDVLAGHKIQTKLDILAITKEHYRILKPNSFYAFFGQMPTILAWYNAAIEAGFEFVEDITWAKRMITSPYLEIQRTFENIFIFRKGKPKFYNTQKRCEDLKTPALHFGIYELSTLKTLFSDLQRRLIDRKYDDLYFSKMPPTNGKIKTNDSRWADKFSKSNQRKKDDLDFYCEELGLEKTPREEGVTMPYAKSNKRNDILVAKMYKPKENANDSIRSANGEGFRYRSKWYNNVTDLWSFIPSEETNEVESIVNFLPKDKQEQILNMILEFIPTENKDLAKENFAGIIHKIWSYLPHNQTKFSKDEFNVKHPTVKPIPLLERLIELCTPEKLENGEQPIVLDSFIGSGTTALACLRTNRKFIGYEIDKQYFEIAQERINKELAQQK